MGLITLERNVLLKNDTHPYVYKAAVWFDDWYADDYNGDILDTNGNKVTI